MCMLNPCGPHAECEYNEKNNDYLCKCLNGMLNRPPNCRPECSNNSHCPDEMLCVNHHCKDPCAIGLCAVTANCTVVNHKPLCACPEHYEGDPYVECTLSILQSRKSNDLAPCDPDPCIGVENTMCVDKNGVGTCVCLPNFYRASKYDVGCKSQCARHTNCPQNHLCIQNECRDPCKAICPENADCHITTNRIAVCTCKSGFTGDAYQNCTKVQQPRKFLLTENHGVDTTNFWCIFSCRNDRRMSE